jgi:hypothetical protein
MFAVRVWGQAYNVPPVSALNQPVKVQPGRVGSAGLATCVPPAALMAATAEPLWVLKVRVY